MKATISIPNPIYEASEQLARKLDVSLSDLYTIALSAYLTTHQEEDVTETLNQVYETEDSTLDPELIRLQLTSIGDERW